ncbi:hypothetical protein RHP47_10615 [Thermosynechococcus sp. QKsg1]|uniref:hypothetical protein n=1 Tax=Thermosynechococcus sp. QKsg1 TaxID=3074130 RepID=UPI002877A25B|nr:hypothetical protein [Thermosynechococcus sp. QKsg1]WNC86285.1 hypothetical protein RHP47_10615 [Thermosynechococcus sp. QKsg1]
MNFSPVTRYKLRNLLAEHPAVQFHRGNDSNGQEYLDRYINLDNLTYPQLNKLEFLIELHEKIKQSEPNQTLQLQYIEQKIFDLIGLQLPVSANTLAVLTSFFSQFAQTKETKNRPPLASANPEALTLADYYGYCQQITEVAARYLGKMIVTNYWLLTRPRESWLAQIQVEQFHNRQFTATDRLLTNHEAETLQQWIHDFIQHCCRILPDLPQILLAARVPSHLLCSLVH